jgi:hypothetical protein
MTVTGTSLYFSKELSVRGKLVSIESGMHSEIHRSQVEVSLPDFLQDSQCLCYVLEVVLTPFVVSACRKAFTFTSNCRNVTGTCERQEPNYALHARWDMPPSVFHERSIAASPLLATVCMRMTN